MQAIVETVFDAADLTLVITLDVRMIRGSRGALYPVPSPVSLHRPPPRRLRRVYARSREKRADFGLTAGSVWNIIPVDKIIKDRILGEFFGAERAARPNPRT